MEIAIIPQILINKISNDFFRQNDYNILISNLLIISGFLIFGSSLISILSYVPQFCLIDKLTGVECPVCGTTRAFCQLSIGNLTNALILNKTSILVASFFIIQIPLRIISILKISLTKKIHIISKYYSRLILIIILINWIIKLFTNY